MFAKQNWYGVAVWYVFIMFFIKLTDATAKTGQSLQI